MAARAGQSRCLSAAARGAAMALLARQVAATWSITAVDTRNGLDGAAGASCVPYEVMVIYAPAPGHGAANVQAGINPDANARIIELLRDDVAPEEIVAEVTDIGFDPNAPKMQYGIADLAGRSAGYTGPLANDHASHRIAAEGDYVLTVQGNFLTSARVLEGALEGFATGCDLPERLVAALEAAAEDGEGDARCVDMGIPAKSAFIEVDGPEDAVVRISLPDVSPDNPIAQLRDQFELWRENHPCPAQPEEPSDDPLTSADAGSCSARRAPTTGSSGAWLVLLLFAIRSRNQNRIHHGDGKRARSHARRRI